MVASDIRDPRFESSHRLIFYIVSVNCVEKTKINQTDAGNCSIFNK